MAEASSRSKTTMIEEIVGEIERRVRRRRGADRADRRGHLSHQRHVSDRTSSTSGFRHRAPRGGLPHGRRLRIPGSWGGAAEPGDDVSWNGVRFDVLEVEGNRIEKIGVTFHERPSARRPGRRSVPGKTSSSRPCKTLVTPLLARKNRTINWTAKYLAFSFKPRSRMNSHTHACGRRSRGACHRESSGVRAPAPATPKRRDTRRLGLRSAQRSR